MQGVTTQPCMHAHRGISTQGNQKTTKRMQKAKNQLTLRGGIHRASCIGSSGGLESAVLNVPMNTSSVGATYPEFSKPNTRTCTPNHANNAIRSQGGALAWHPLRQNSAEHGQLPPQLSGLNVVRSKRCVCVCVCDAGICMIYPHNSWAAAAATTVDGDAPWTGPRPASACASLRGSAPWLTAHRTGTQTPPPSRR